MSEWDSLLIHDRDQLTDAAATIGVPPPRGELVLRLARWRLGESGFVPISPALINQAMR